MILQLADAELAPDVRLGVTGSMFERSIRRLPTPSW